LLSDKAVVDHNARQPDRQMLPHGTTITSVLFVSDVGTSSTDGYSGTRRILSGRRTQIQLLSNITLLYLLEITITYFNECR
jgi:hypothetical protein